MDADELLQNDPTILDCELLYRGIHASQVTADNMVSSAAFISRTNPHVSVDLSSLSTPEETHKRRSSDAGVVQLVTGQVRTTTPGVVRNPIDGNPAHALIIHDYELSNSKWKEVARHLAKMSVWAIVPPKNSCAT